MKEGKTQVGATLLRCVVLTGELRNESVIGGYVES